MSHWNSWVQKREGEKKKACRSTHNASNLTSKLFSSYTFIAVIHKCLVLITVVTPCLEMVSFLNGGLNLIVVPLVAALAPPNRTAVTVKSALQKLCQIESIVPCFKWLHRPVLTEDMRSTIKVAVSVIDKQILFTWSSRQAKHGGSGTGLLCGTAK